MRKTENFELNLLDAEDFVNREDLNENAEKIDEVMKSLDTPEYDVSEQTNIEKLSSGESLKVALRKLAKAVADYISHKADQVVHITAEERNAWNAKLGTEKIAANLTTDTDGMVLAAAMGKNLKEQIDTNANAISTLNSNMPIFIKDKHTVSLDTTCDEALYTLYTAEKPCFVSFTSLLYWIHSCPTELTFRVNIRDNLYSAKAFTSKNILASHIHLSGCVYLNTGEEIKVFATGSQTAEDDIYSTLMINYV